MSPSPSTLVLSSRIKITVLESGRSRRRGGRFPVGNTDIVLFDGLMIGRGEERGA